MSRLPVVQYTILCDRIERSPVYSLLNLTDEVHVLLEPTAARPKRETSAHIPTQLVVGMYHGAPGQHSMSVTWLAPSGALVEPIAEEQFVWPTGDVRHRVEAALKLPVFEYGEHRLEIRIDGELVLQPPINVRIRRRAEGEPARKRLPVSLQYAMFCRERDRGEKDLSIIGAYDSLAVVQPVPQGQKPPPRRYPLKLAMGLVGEGGQRTIQLQPILPSGTSAEPIERILPWDVSAVFHHHVFDINMEIPEDGLYTFVILVDGVAVGQALVKLNYRVEEIPQDGGE